MPEFTSNLQPTQAKILHQIIKRKWPLRYFFISVHENQMTDFENMHGTLRDDLDRQAVLRELSHQFPEKLDLPQSREPLELLFGYNQILFNSIDQT